MPSACHHRLAVATTAAVSFHDLTAELQALVEAAGIREGLLTAVGQHTTTALVINEAEERLMHDIERFFTALVPADRPWRHNDLHLRDVPPDEPRNAHSHLIALMLGNQLCVPIVEGRLGLGRYQALLLVELDGPRQREVLVRIANDA